MSKKEKSGLTKEQAIELVKKARSLNLKAVDGKHKKSVK